jgi:hypothetical protein
MIHDLPKWAYIQALLSKGDRKVGKYWWLPSMSGRLEQGSSGDQFQSWLLCLSKEGFRRGLSLGFHRPWHFERKIEGRGSMIDRSYKDLLKMQRFWNIIPALTA